jgi:uncharacterized small protein (DUF1192 family)
MGRRPIGERAMTNAERVRRHRAAKAQEAAIETLAVAERDERIRQLEAEVRRLQERVRQLERERPRASIRIIEPEHHEDVLHGVAAIAKALGTTPRKVHELRARHGLPVFPSGRTLCARADELDRWRTEWQREADEP